MNYHFNKFSSETWLFFWKENANCIKVFLMILLWVSHKGRKEVENTKPHNGQYFNVVEQRWSHSVVILFFPLSVSGMAGSNNPSVQNHGWSHTNMVLSGKYWTLFLTLFLLLGTETNKTPKAEEVKSSDSFSEVSIVI